MRILGQLADLFDETTWKIIYGVTFGSPGVAFVIAFMWLIMAAVRTRVERVKKQIVVTGWMISFAEVIFYASLVFFWVNRSSGEIGIIYLFLGLLLGGVPLAVSILVGCVAATMAGRESRTRTGVAFAAEGDTGN